MPVQDNFQELIRLVRAGDAQAAAQLVQEYESVVRVAVRYRLTDPHLSRVLDSMDIAQSVMASFFARAALGQYELESPAQLVALLVGMAQNKLAHQVRFHHQQKRDVRRVDPNSEAFLSIAPNGPAPDRVITMRDLWQKLYHQLDPAARALAEQRMQSKSWDQIAEEQQGNPATLRKQLNRAIQLAVTELGLDAELLDE